MQIETELNRQQKILTEKLMDARGLASHAEALRLAFLGFADELMDESVWRERVSRGQPTAPAREPDLGDLREDFVLEPVTGKALPVYKGEVLRIIQEEDGGQCVDFNGFNLYDYKEKLDVGRVRAHNGIFPRQGSVLVSSSPRNRAMYSILRMPESCRAETLGVRCAAYLFEYVFGFELHTNCQDTFAAAIGEYDLTPDDVHDSFNMWMNTEIDIDGNIRMCPNSGRKGDYVDLLAVFDTLSVPIVCGSGDVLTTSNFALKPIHVQVYAPSDETSALSRELDSTYNSLRNVRSPDGFKVSQINASRELRRNPDYTPEWVNYPLEGEKVKVDLEDADYERLKEIRERRLAPGLTDGDVLRSAALIWYGAQRVESGDGHRPLEQFAYSPW